MKRETYDKLFKAGIATALVTSAVVAVTPDISQANGKSDSAKEKGKEPDKGKL